jgi:hypothetical protein
MILFVRRKEIMAIPNILTKFVKAKEKLAKVTGGNMLIKIMWSTATKNI